MLHPPVQLSSTPTFGVQMPKTPQSAPKPFWALQEESGLWGTEEMWRSSLCEGFSSSDPAIPEHQGSVCSYFRKKKTPTWISSGKRGRVGRFSASKQGATVPKACHETCEVSPTHPLTSCTQHTDGKMSSSEALPNSQALALEAKTKHIQKIHG